MRRNALDAIAHDPTTHAGLWFDKYIQGGEFDAPRKAALIQDLARSAVPAKYREFVEYLRRCGDKLVDCAKGISAEATVAGRMVVGLGAKGVAEAGIRLDHTWGVPVIPGSALKGLAASTAHLLVEDPGWRKRTEGEERGPTPFDTLFGTTDEQGEVIFHDAYWIPDGQTLPIHPDVMTVHHPGYYQGDDPSAPTDFDSPTPIPFASATGKFLVLLEGNPERCEEAFQLLEHGLHNLGVGAKTSSGYGRMKVRRLETEGTKRFNQYRDLVAKAEPKPQTANEIVKSLRDSGLSRDQLRRVCGSLEPPLLAAWRLWAKPQDSELKILLWSLLPELVEVQRPAFVAAEKGRVPDLWEQVVVAAQEGKKFLVTCQDGSAVLTKDGVPIDDDQGFRAELRGSPPPGCPAEAVVDRSSRGKIKVKKLRRPR